MRISWNTQFGADAYREDCWLYTVLFNGGPTPPKCFYADEEGGEIRCFAIDAQGKTARDPNNRGQPKIDVHRGDVKIVHKDVA